MKLDYKLLKSLSKEYGDSFYILDTNKFENNYVEFITSFKKKYANTHIGYSYKTNYIPKICSIINNKNEYAEVVSEMEYDLAIKIGVDPTHIIVNGPYKTKSSLIKYFTQGSLVNIDSLYEIQYIKEISQDYPKTILKVGIRCNFQINNTYDSRFGIDIDSDELYKAFYLLNNIPNVSIEGIHCHFPDRQLDLYKKRVQTMLKLSQKLFEKPPKFIDIGGGYFGKMPLEHAEQFGITGYSYEDYANLIAGEFSNFFRNFPDEEKPILIVEPGTALVADTMKFVTKTIEIKKIKNKLIVITSGSKFNLGSFCSKINLPLAVYTQFPTSELQKNIYEISGYTCMENDYLYTDYYGIINQGDFLVFSNVVSYSVVIKPPFILPNFAIIELDTQNKVSLIKRKETIDDVFITYNF